MSIGSRLREERERLEMNQTDFGAAVGVTRKTQFNYEADERLPDAGYLVRCREAGVDVLHVLFGDREFAPQWVLTADEGLLLKLYREASADRRAATLGALVGAVPAKDAAARTVFNGPVGGVNSGHVSGPVSIDMRGSVGKKKRD